MKLSHINYKIIFLDILEKKYPNKKEICLPLLNKEKFSAMEIVKLNFLVFGKPDKESALFNQRHRSYSELDILEILKYQEKNNLSNSQLANHFKLSRNTVAKWKKSLERSVTILKKIRSTLIALFQFLNNKRKSFCIINGTFP